MHTKAHSQRSIFAGLLLALSLTFNIQSQTVGSTPDDTILKQVIIFGRHGVRSPALPASTLAAFSPRPYPDFGVPTGYLTPHGKQAETLLGAYFNQYLLSEGLLTGDSKTDLARSYFRANSIQRSNISAAALGAGLIPNATIPVHSFPLGTPDAVFDPISAGIVTPNTARAAIEEKGIFNNGAAFASEYSAEFSLIHNILYGGGPVPTGLVDPTTIPIPLTANTSNVATANVINSGGLADTLYAADPFVMEYTDGLDLNDVAWGGLNLQTLSQQTRIITADFAVEVLPPYLNQLQSSNAAAHILRSMEQSVTREQVPGAFTTTPHTRLLVINSSDAYVVGIAGLLHAHWLLPGYQQDYCAPGGSLVFELREARSTGEFLVRTYYTAQTFDQLRNLTPLTLTDPPATQQLLIPGGSKSDMNLDVDFDTFQKLLRKAIDPRYVQDPYTETAPPVLTGVPLQ